MPTQVKPGVQTSEFWLTLLVQIVGGSVTVGLVPQAGIVAKLVALVLMVLSAYGYTKQRTDLKAAKSV
jgi:Na+-transporting NADH:ubiquinone oxidoreductase subunit NqrD